MLIVSLATDSVRPTHTFQNDFFTRIVTDRFDFQT